MVQQLAIAEGQGVDLLLDMGVLLFEGVHVGCRDMSEDLQLCHLCSNLSYHLGRLQL